MNVSDGPARGGTAIGGGGNGVALRALAAAVALAACLVALAAPAPASAARIGIYVVAPTWLGNCANSQLGGSVRELHVSNWTPGATTYAHDAGDDIVWIGASSYTTNTIVAQPFCFGWWGRRGGAASSHSIYPRDTDRPFGSGRGASARTDARSRARAGETSVSADGHRRAVVDGATSDSAPGGRRRVGSEAPEIAQVDPAPTRVRSPLGVAALGAPCRASRCRRSREARHGAERPRIRCARPAPPRSRTRRRGSRLRRRGRGSAGWDRWPWCRTRASYFPRKYGCG